MAASNAAVARESGWGARSSAPAWLMTIIVLAAAVYAFSPRTPPPFPVTQVHADGLLVTGLVPVGKGWVAAGEQGQILLAQSPRGPWRSATVAPQRGSTFTQLAFINERIGFAVGHDGWLVRSADGGETWAEVAFNPELSDPLMNIAGPYDGTLYAMGAFGLLMTSTDEGKSWQRQTLTEAVDPNAPVVPAAEADPNADPFADFQSGSAGIGDRHLNAMTRLADGALLLVGERGLLARSDDQGKTWLPLPEVYSGSFYGVINTDTGVLVYGMRGNAFHSRDSGKTWVKSELPSSGSLFGAALTRERHVVLVGENNSVLLSKDGGLRFALVSQEGHDRLTAVVPTEAGLLTAGEKGIRLHEAAGATGATP